MPIGRNNGGGLLLIVLGLVTLIGCGGEDQGEDPAYKQDQKSSSSASPSETPVATEDFLNCDEVIKEGIVISQRLADQGCMQEDGTLALGGFHECDDGRQLLAEHGLYGFVEEPAKAGDAGSPGFARAYEECTGG